MSCGEAKFYECGKTGEQKCECLIEVVVCGDTCPDDYACCGTPMKEVQFKTADAANEKHVPVVEKVDGGYKVTVGSTIHPMTEEHHIEWIEIRSGDEVQRKYLHPGQEPIATFKTDADHVHALEHCNIHGMWIQK